MARQVTEEPEDNPAFIINQLDGRRNEIVHWQLTQTSSSISPIVEVSLRPAFFATRSSALPLLLQDLQAFTAKAQFAEKSLHHLWLINRHPQKFSDSELQTWHGIFQKPATYPPPKGHPFYSSPTEP